MASIIGTPTYSTTFGSAVSLGSSVSAGDVIVIASSRTGTTTHGTATITGVTCTMAEQLFVATPVFGGGNDNGITFLTGTVSGSSGTPSANVTNANVGWLAWLVNGLSSSTAHATGSGSNSTANPLLIGSTTTSVQCAIFTMYCDAFANHFSSFTDSVTQDHAGTTAAPNAHGHKLALAAGTYTYGVNLTIGDTHDLVASIFLPETVASGVTYPQLERGIRGLNRGIAMGSFH